MSEPPADPTDRPGGEPDSRRAALLGLVVIALLVLAALYLMQALHRKSQLEDCLMSGRRNCAPIETPLRGR
jgi:hypothetical protein